MMRRTPDQWDSDLAWFAAMEGDTQTGQLYRDIRHDMALLAASVPSTHSPAESRDQTALREAGKTPNGDQVTPENRNNAASDNAAELNS